MILWHACWMFHLRSLKSRNIKDIFVWMLLHFELSKLICFVGLIVQRIDTSMINCHLFNYCSSLCSIISIIVMDFYWHNESSSQWWSFIIEMNLYHNDKFEFSLQWCMSMSAMNVNHSDEFSIKGCIFITLINFNYSDSASLHWWNFLTVKNL